VTDSLDELGALAIVHARAGELPPGALEASSEAGGAMLVVGDGAAQAAAAARSATRAWCCDTGPGLRASRLAGQLRSLVAGIPLLILPGTPDGRDLAPRLAALLSRPLLSNACRTTRNGCGVRADLCRLDDRVIIPSHVEGAAVVTIAPGAGTITEPGVAVTVHPIELPAPAGDVAGAGTADVTVLEVLEPDPSTMELAEAPLVFGGGAGLAAGLDLRAARATFGLLAGVAAAVGASAGASRVATDAGWTGPDRQIGTTGVTIAARLYVAFGVSGATQHTGGLRSPAQIVSVNLDAHCPMTAMSSLGIVADARGTLTGLADRLGVEVPAEVRDAR
jgi:electron transfer flavoprotein alpha subunit